VTNITSRTGCDAVRNMQAYKVLVGSFVSVATALLSLVLASTLNPCAKMSYLRCCFTCCFVDITLCMCVGLSQFVAVTKC